MRHIRQAAVEHVELSGNLPSTYDWGVRPVELSGASDTTRYGYKDVEYRLVTDEGTGRVEFRARYAETSPIGLALLQYRRPGTEDGSVSWTPTETTSRLFTVSAGSAGNGNGNGNSGGNGGGNGGGGGASNAPAQTWVGQDVRTDPNCRACAPADSGSFAEPWRPLQVGRG